MNTWPEQNLGELVEILSGFAFDSNQFADSGEMPIIRIRDIIPGYSSTFYSGDYDPKYIIQDGDVLIGMDGEFNRARWRGGKALLNQRVCRISVSSKYLDEGYLFHFLPSALKAIEDATPFVTVKHLSVKSIREIKIPLPPLPEQKRIADILDRAEALRAKCRDAIAQLDELTQSIFVDMFGDPVKNLNGWQRVPLAELLTNIDSGWSPSCLDRPVEGKEWGVLKLSAVTRCEYNPTENKALPDNILPDPNLEVKQGDLLFTRKNTYELIAACAFVRETPPRLMMSDLIFRLRLRQDAKIDPNFLHQLLIFPTKRREIQKIAGGSAGSMPNISKTRLNTVLIEIPPLSLQKEFAQHIEAVERLKTAHKASLAELDELFISLQYRAFRGEL